MRGRCVTASHPSPSSLSFLPINTPSQSPLLPFPSLLLLFCTAPPPLLPFLRTRAPRQRGATVLEGSINKTGQTESLSVVKQSTSRQSGCRREWGRGKRGGKWWRELGKGKRGGMKERGERGRGKKEGGRGKRDDNPLTTASACYIHRSSSRVTRAQYKSIYIPDFHTDLPRGRVHLGKHRTNNHPIFLSLFSFPC